MNDPDPGQSTTIAAVAGAPGDGVTVLFHADIAGDAAMQTLAGGARAAARAALHVANEARAELTVVITDDSEMQALNSRFRGIDEPTNVLSFPEPQHAVQAETLFLGDVIVSHDTLAREADAQGKSFVAHTAHLVAHGVLHLLGYMHDDDEAAARMEALEVRALAQLGFPDPYNETQHVEADAEPALNRK